MNYMNRGVIQSGVATPTSAGVEAYVGATVNFAVYGIETTTIVAGTETAHKLQLIAGDGSTVLAECLVGTSAIGVSKRAAVGYKSDGTALTGIDASDCVITAGQYCQIKSVTNDASAKYSYRLIGDVAL
jgi:hypothetical protein